MVLMFFSLGFSIISMLIILIQPLSLGFVIMLISIFMSVMVSFLFILDMVMYYF